MHKTLVLLRHAKAEAGTPTQEDKTRALVTRGIHSALAVGAYAKSEGIGANLVLCSSAVRTRETLTHFESAYGGTLPVSYRDGLYHATSSELISELEKADEEVHSLWLIGHNPGIHQLCLKLGKEGEEELLDHMMMKFPTCALATLEFEGDWAEIGFAHARLTRFVTPKMLGIPE